MSIFASILRSVYKLSGAKKAFALPEDALRKEIEKQNRHRGVFTPTDRKAYYETIAVNGFPCLIVREHPKPSERAILYFFGGGMVIGPDKGDLPVMRKLCRETGCDVWFPFYPLCMEHCITETYAMVYECYRKMITLYGGGNVSTCGFSSGGALALGVANHILMLENAVYSVLSPEGFASILWKDSSRSGEACEIMKLTAQDLYKDGIVEEIIPEPVGGAQRSHAALFAAMDTALKNHLTALCKMSGKALADQRYKKFRQIGEAKRA
mgnify:CR=1 FL=1